MKSGLVKVGMKKKNDRLINKEVNIYIFFINTWGPNLRSRFNYIIENEEWKFQGKVPFRL